MAPINHGNVATFHGIPNTSGLQLPALFEMPKLTATVPMTPSQTINSYPNFPMDIPQSSNQTTPNPSTFFPASLLMPCNLSFTPQQLAFYALQMQHQQTQQQSPPAITNQLLNSAMNPMNSTMSVFPALIQQPFIGNLSLNAATLPIIQTSAATQLFHQHQQQLTPKPEQSPPTATTFFHPAFFNTANLSLNNPSSLFSAHANHHRLSNAHSTPTLPETSTQQNDQAPPQLTKNDQQISPPRNESPELNDSTLPPMLQPELPCFNDLNDTEDFSAPPELLPPDRFMFDDECGPPKLEPQMPITIIPESSEHRNKSIKLCPISPPSTELMPTKINEPHPLLAHRPILAAMLMGVKRAPPSSPKFSVQSPTVSTTADCISINRKRERSASVDSSDVMLKMPKLVPMVEECAPKVEEQKPQLEEVMPLIENNDEIENNEELENIETTEVESESNKEVEVMSKQEVEVESKQEVEVESKEETPEKQDTSMASSSGVSSANTSLLTEEPPIIMRFKRSSLDSKIVEPVETERTERIIYNDFEEFELSPSPLLPVQNKLRPRQQRVEPKKKPAKQIQKARINGKAQTRKYIMKGRKGAPKSKRIEIQSDWQPIDNGQIVDVRLHNETQTIKRRCYKAIRHNREVDEIIRIRDCVKVRSSEGLENIGKVLRIYLDEPSGAICIQVLWYYTPEQLPAESEISVHEKELLASKHCDVINADAIEEHAYVLTFSEYCRFVAETRLDELPPTQRPLETKEVASRGDLNYGRRSRLPHEDSPIDLVYWCRRTFSIKTKKVCVSATTSRRGSRNGRRYR